MNDSFAERADVAEGPGRDRARSERSIQMNCIEKQAAFYRGYLTDERSLGTVRNLVCGAGLAITL
jgi:hypothetical protein